jgi:hypothetical protein
MHLMVLMVHNWFKNALYQSCTISTIRKWFLLHSISTIRKVFGTQRQSFFLFTFVTGTSIPSGACTICVTPVFYVQTITPAHPYMNRYGIISDYVSIVSPVSWEDGFWYTTKTCFGLYEKVLDYPLRERGGEGRVSSFFHIHLVHYTRLSLKYTDTYLQNNPSLRFPLTPWTPQVTSHTKILPSCRYSTTT